MPFFIGYSSTEGRGLGSNTLYDVYLCRQGLFNQFNTPLGSIPGMPWFGSELEDIVFAPNTAANVQRIQADVIRVIKTDPRLEFLDLDLLQPDQFTVQLSVLLNFTPTQTPFQLQLSYQQGITAQEALSSGQDLINS